MEAGKKVRRRNSIVRIALVGISLLMQLGWLLVLVLRLNAHYELIATVTGLISVAAVLRLYSRQTTSAMKMPWVVLILSLPVMGLCLYLLAQRFAAPRTMTRRLAQSRGKIAPCMGQESPVLQELEQADPAASGNSRYLQERCRWPVYRDTAVTYYPQAAQAYEAMLRDLEQAERFIFMEYFIIEDAQSFDALRQILARKASQGVQVRIMYDDVGSVGYLQSRFARQLRSQGLDCRVFGQVMPVLNLYMNYRDHRKITVIDGKVGFTGGYNLAGE